MTSTSKIAIRGVSPATKGDIPLARVIAACLNAPRFCGRSALVVLAQTGDTTALVALESHAKHRKILALRGLLSSEVTHALDLPEIREQEQIRRARAKARYGTRRYQTTQPVELRADPLASRRPGGARERATIAALREALLRAHFREAQHSHETSIRYSDKICAAESSRATLSPSAAGLSASYVTQGFRITSSCHVFVVSPEIFKVPREKRWDGKHLWLSPTVRVRQGRGTALVCEQKIGRKWQRAPKLQLELFR